MLVQVKFHIMKMNKDVSDDEYFVNKIIFYHILFICEF